MARVETAYPEADAERLARIALELDDTVSAYKRSEIEGVAWLAVTEDFGGDSPICANCGSQFSASSNCPGCGAPRVGINTVSIPDRFTVTVSEMEAEAETEPKAGSSIAVGLHGDDDNTAYLGGHLPFVEMLQELLKEVDSIEAAEKRLLREQGGYTKESDTVQARVRRQVDQPRVEEDTGAEEEDHLLEIMKILFVLGILFSGMLLLFTVGAAL